MIQFMLAALVASAVVWQPVRPGVWYRESPMATKGSLASVRVVAVRIDPRVARFSLHSATRDDGTRGRWTVDSIGDAGVLAFNAGQFRVSGAWGWIVQDGVEVQPPGSGSVVMSFVVDSTGVVSLLEQGEVDAKRRHVRVAFQSYPAL